MESDSSLLNTPREVETVGGSVGGGGTHGNPCRVRSVSAKDDWGTPLMML
jgi:hypothetical protein